MSGPTKPGEKPDRIQEPESPLPKEAPGPGEPLPEEPIITPPPEPADRPGERSPEEPSPKPEPRPDVPDPTKEPGAV
jgi:protein TonB